MILKTSAIKLRCIVLSIAERTTRRRTVDYGLKHGMIGTLWLCK
jgi:hypothetical protein